MGFITRFWLNVFPRDDDRQFFYFFFLIHEWMDSDGWMDGWMIITLAYTKPKNFP